MSKHTTRFILIFNK